MEIRILPKDISFDELRQLSDDHCIILLSRSSFDFTFRSIESLSFEEVSTIYSNIYNEETEDMAFLLLK